jgi:outer membrane protein assembly factor BamB
MKARFASIVVAGTVLATLVAHAQGSAAGSSGAERSLLTYAIAGFTLQFGALDLATGKFFPIAPVPPDVGTGLVHGRGTSLLYLAFSGKLTALDPFFGTTSIVGDGTGGLGDCSVPGSYALNCAIALGQVGGHLYATDFANNLYSVDPKTGAATLIGPTGMPPLEFAPPRANSDGTLDVVSESLVSYRGKLYANFATVKINPDGTFDPIIPGGLYQIDPSTGMSTPIASVDSNITAMVNVHDTVYAFDAWTGEVLRLDMTTGLTEATEPKTVIDQTAGSLIVGAAPARPSPTTLR